MVIILIKYHYESGRCGGQRGFGDTTASANLVHRESSLKMQGDAEESGRSIDAGEIHALVESPAPSHFFKQDSARFWNAKG